jgi:hypothetical protein
LMITVNALAARTWTRRRGSRKIRTSGTGLPPACGVPQSTLYITNLLHDNRVWLKRDGRDVKVANCIDVVCPSRNLERHHSTPILFIYIYICSLILYPGVMVLGVTRWASNPHYSSIVPNKSSTPTL